jgi:hypothetical protein
VHIAFIKTINKRSPYVLTSSNVGNPNTNRDVAQIDIPTLLDVRTYGDRLLIVFYKGEIRRFIVVIYNSEVYTGTYY